MEEEEAAHIHGWDFSHIHGRYEEEMSLPWDYRAIIKEYLTPGTKLLDYDTGGGEFLLSLGHPFHNLSATEGYEPNVKLCREKLLPLGIDFKECGNPAKIPYDDEGFDLIINRHGSFDAKELYRLLKPGGVFITQQVGEDNDRDLVERVLPGLPKPFPHLNLTEQRKAFEQAGFRIIRGEEAYQPIRFYDVGAFVWFARIIQWEFPIFRWRAALGSCWIWKERWWIRGRWKGRYTGILLWRGSRNRSLPLIRLKFHFHPVVSCQDSPFFSPSG